MDQDRWDRVNRIFHAALEVEPGERGALVSTLAGSDPEVQSEVEQLLQADEDVGEYLDAPLISAEVLANASSAPLQPGELLCGRFRIVREIAEGGMGHVFEAFDTELAVPVALKTIRPEIAANPEAIARFRQEVRLARTITHPNICRTFDLEREVRSSAAASNSGPRGELVFLTMEYLSGETLSASIKRRGALPIQEARAIAGQVADALTAAHKLDIIHRDMKPANIMLVSNANGSTGTPRVVVMDFGLARLDPLVLDGSPLAGNGSSFTHATNPIGTLAYMAPEQLEGAAVSPATDIYAFGLILFEMATGRRAFPSQNLLSGIAQRLKGSPALDQMLTHDVPPGWREAIRACLLAEPELRPRTPAEVLALLDGHVTAPKREKHTPRAAVTPSRRRWWIATAATLAAVALLALGLRFYSSRSPSQVAPGALVYLTPVQNQTGVAAFDGVGDLLQASIAQSIQVNLLDRGRVGDILQQMTRPADATIDASTAREIAMRAGAARVIFATVTGEDGSYTLNIDIQQPDNTPVRFREHWTRSFTWQQPTSGSDASTIPPGLLASVRSASDWMRLRIGESSNDIARLDAPPEDVTTNSWQALAEYDEAVQLNRAQRPSDAVQALRNAIHLDPQFALAYGQLADIQQTLHHETEAFEAYKQALSPALERRLSRRERDRISGMYALDTWDYATAVDAFRDYQAFYPNDRLAWLYSVAPLNQLNRSDEAVANLKRAQQLEPDSPSPAISLADEYVIQGKTAEARAALQQADAISKTSSSLYIAALIDFEEGNYGDAKTTLVSLENSADPRERSRVFDTLADLAAERGSFAEAIGFLNQGMQDDSAQGNPAAAAMKLADRAWMKAKLGDNAGCAEDLRTALAGDPSPQLTIMAETILGEAIQLASPSASRPLRRQLIEIDSHIKPGDFGIVSRNFAMRSHAEASLASGNIAQALQQFRELSAVDAPAAPREYLGRALMAAAAAEPVPQHAASLRHEAEQAYATVALRPGIIWSNPYKFPPGFFADQLSAYLTLADTLKDRSETVQRAHTQWASLRGGTLRASTNNSSQLPN